MGGYSQFPALMIKSPQSPLQDYAQAQQVAMGQQQIQAAQLENQQRQQQVKDQAALTKAYSQWTPGQDQSTLGPLFSQAGGSGQGRQALEAQIRQAKQQISETAKNDAIANQDTLDTQVKQNDQYRGRLLNVISIQDPMAKQTAWQNEITAESKAGTKLPQGITLQYPGDTQATAIANSFAMGSQLVKEAQEQERIKLDAWKPVSGKLVNAISGETIGGFTPTNVATINQGLAARWAVLNPGKPVPSYFQLQPNDGPQEFANVDKLLAGTEASQATQAQREQVNAIRAQTFEMARDKADMKAVTGIDPRSGNMVVLPKSQADQIGMRDYMQASDDVVNKSLAARHWLNLALKPGDPASKDPADQSIMQLINNLDSEGKLGPLASRWNDFLAGKFGSGDPEYAALNAKLGLSTTLLQQAHVGNRGGAQLLEHFEDLANQKKMDGPTLKAGFQSEINYMRDKAGDPNPPSYATGAAAQSGGQIVVKDPQGGSHFFADQASADKFKKLAGIP
jgi:hypothetical protein